MSMNMNSFLICAGRTHISVFFVPNKPPVGWLRERKVTFSHYCEDNLLSSNVTALAKAALCFFLLYLLRVVIQHKV